ncbi:hypothetical protein EV688_110111 [Chromatocurvus halotolerans]|uniref:Uncharacterized protein n=1 Tax=Chromatocurvus halotolerans TaxID=1132028 RepID=A0A4R2KVE8_9GAMM|nr:hypothetical protein EV688_110111 [Chromatocurvus halotolerans]
MSVMGPAFAKPDTRQVRLINNVAPPERLRIVDQGTSRDRRLPGHSQTQPAARTLAVENEDSLGVSASTPQITVVALAHHPVL